MNFIGKVEFFVNVDVLVFVFLNENFVVVVEVGVLLNENFVEVLEVGVLLKENFDVVVVVGVLNEKFVVVVVFVWVLKLFVNMYIDVVIFFLINKFRKKIRLKRKSFSVIYKNMFILV